MLYSEILDALYNGTLNDVLKVLNRSVYSTKLNKLDNELFIIHTGFSFTTHKGKEMEIYVGFSTTSNEIVIIRQSRADWSYRWVPLLNGIVVKITEKNHHLNQVDHKFCDEVKEINNDYQIHFIELETSDSILNLDAKKLIDTLGLFSVITEKEVLKFPWTRKLSQKVYLDGLRFSSTAPRIEEDNDSDKRQSFDEYLRDDYDNDSETAYWNTE